MQKLYVLVRSDLYHEYQAVQAGHAVAEWLVTFPDTQWRNETLVYLNVKDEFELEKWCFKLKDNNLKYAEFREPDIGNQMTAISCLTDTDIFKKLPLLKFNK